MFKDLVESKDLQELLVSQASGEHQDHKGAQDPRGSLVRQDHEEN